MKQTGKSYLQFSTTLLMLLLGIIACGLPTEIPPTPTPNQTATAAFELIKQTATAVALTPTATPTNTATNAPNPSPTLPCDLVIFTELTPQPDRTILKFNSTANEVWQFKNAGSCTWNTQYQVRYINGNQLDTNSVYPLPGDIRPGDAVNIPIQVITGDKYEYMESTWALYNATGAIVNQLGSSDPTFKIKIIASDAYYDFVREACQNQTLWLTSSSKVLSCPGLPSDNQGFVIPLTYFRNTKIPTEDNNNEYYYGLLMSAGSQTDGFISGIYPPQTIHANDYFHAQVGCLYKEGGSPCNIRFQISARSSVPGEPDKILAEQYQLADGQLGSFDINLTLFAGQNIQMILTVITNGTANNNQAIWLSPRIAADNH